MKLRLSPVANIHLSFLDISGDDAQALVWDLSQMKKLQQEPLLTYTAASEINQLSWSRTHGDWIAIAHGNVVEALKI